MTPEYEQSPTRLREMIYVIIWLALAITLRGGSVSNDLYLPTNPPVNAVSDNSPTCHESP